MTHNKIVSWHTTKKCEKITIQKNTTLSVGTYYLCLSKMKVALIVISMNEQWNECSEWRSLMTERISKPGSSPSVTRR